jgi:hypothetical protein
MNHTWYFYLPAHYQLPTTNSQLFQKYDQSIRKKINSHPMSHSKAILAFSLLAVLGREGIATAQSPAPPQQDPPEVTRRLWKEMLEAKGGDRLAQVHSFQMTAAGHSLLRSSDDTRADAVVLAKLPGQWWFYWRQGPPLGTSIRCYDEDKEIAWDFNDRFDSARPQRKETIDDELKADLILYLFAAAGDAHPELIESSQDKTGARITVLYAGQAAAFTLDPVTHLPSEVDILPELNPEQFSRREKTVVLLKDYHAVDGIMVPGKVNTLGEWRDVQITINPELDDKLFTTPPSRSDKGNWRAYAGPYAPTR